MADDFRDFVKFDGFAGQAWYHQMIRDKRILRRAREFTPERLLEKGEQGVWYDPSDLSTLFQDSAGTTPVTASGQPVGLMLDKSGRGNHATQATAASRPIYRRGDSRGVVNLLRWSEDFANAVWVKTAATIAANAITSPDGTANADKLVESAANAAHVVSRVPSGLTISTVYTYSLFVKSAGRQYVRLATSTGFGSVGVTVDLTTGAISGLNGAATVTDEGGGWFRISMTGTAAATNPELYIAPRTTSGSGSSAYQGDGTSGIYIWGAQINLGPTALPYQRNDSHLGGVATGASTDLHWLETDGVDDGMVTGNIDFTGTDKVSVFAGVRKLSDAGFIFAELGPGSGVNSFTLQAPPSAPQPGYRFTSRGGLLADASISAGYPAPDTTVITGKGDISGDFVSLRLDGQMVASSTADQGTGNFGNYPLYLFRRGGTSLPFNGWFYGLAITGRLTTDAETVATERYLAAKASVVLP